MPYFRLETNLEKSKIPATFLQLMTKAVARALDKAESRCCSCIVPDQMMSFGGSTDLCGYAYLMTIGNNPLMENEKISAALSSLIENELDIPKKRLFIEFSDRVPCDVGSCGTTVQEIRNQGKY